MGEIELLIIIYLMTVGLPGAVPPGRLLGFLLLEIGFLHLFLGVGEGDLECLGTLGGQLEHGVHHDGFDDGAQSACAQLVLYRLVDDVVERRLVEGELNAVA